MFGFGKKKKPDMRKRIMNREIYGGLDPKYIKKEFGSYENFRSHSVRKYNYDPYTGKDIARPTKNKKGQWRERKYLPTWRWF